MTKKLLIPILIIALVLGLISFWALSGSGKSPDSSDDSSVPDAEEDTIDYAKVQIAMSSHNNEQLFLVSDGWIYTTDFDAETGLGNFVRKTLDGKKTEILEKECDATYLVDKGDSIYGVFWYRDEGPVLGSCAKDGSGLKRLVEGAMDLQFVGTDIYYNWGESEDYSYYNVDYYRYDQKNDESTLILKQATYDNYVVGDDVYYIDDEAGLAHVYNMISQEDKALTDEYSVRFTIDGTYGYYISGVSEAESGKLIKFDLSTGASEVLTESITDQGYVIVGEQIFYANSADGNTLHVMTKEGKDDKQLSEDANIAYLYSDGEYLMYYTMLEDNTVDHLYCCKLDGSDKIQVDADTE